MSKLDTNFVKQLYSNRGIELTPEKLRYISENYASNEEVESSFNIKYAEPQEPKTDPEKKNQNSTTTSTKTPSVSPTQQRERKPTSVGGKPIQTGASASSAGKGKEKKSFEDTKVIYINKDSRRGEVDDMSTPPPAGYRYEVVQNSAQLKKWKEQKTNIKEESLFGEPVQSFQEQKAKEFEGTKKKEEAKKQSDLKSMPVLGQDVKLNAPKADLNTTDMSGVKKAELKPIAKTEQVSKNQIVNVAYDSAVNNLDTSLSEQKYQDEVNEKQFTDGIKQGLINVYNDVIANPLSSITNLDLAIKKSKPLDDQYKEIAKIEQKEKVSYSPELKAKMAKDMFIEEENKKQMYTLIDKALPSGYDRDGIWKELKLQSIKSNDQLRSTIASAEVFKGKINQFNDFFKENYKDLDEIEGGNEDKGNKYVFEIGGKKITLSESKYQEYEKLRQEAIDAKSKLESMSLDIDKIYNKASKDDELLDLFKYNYNDFQATKDRVLGGVGEIIGGGLKLLGEGSNYIEDKIGFAPGLALIPNVSDKAVEAGNALLDISQEEKEQYLRYNASDLTWDNLPSFGLQLFSEQLPVFLSIGLAGPGGLAAVSAGSGGRQFRDLEIEEQNNPFVRYSQGQKLTSAFLYGGAEYAGEFFGTRVLLKGFGNTIRNASLQNRRLFYDGMIKSTIKSLPKVATGAGIEGGSELATGLMQIGTDLGVLGKDMKSKEAFERLYEQGFSGAFMGGGMAVAANNMQAVAAQAKVFSSRKDMMQVGKLLNEIDALNQELNNNPLLNEEDKAIIYKDMNSKTNEAFGIVSKNSGRESDFSISEKAELLSINANQIELKEEYDKINSSNINDKLKKQKIEDLNKKFNALEGKRNDILNKTYNAFNYLPEEEQTKLKLEAAEVIIQEQVDNGIEKDKIQEPNAEVINKKAKELYNQKTQEDAKTKQTDGQITSEEKPTTTTKEQAVSTAQQVDAGVQTQEEVVTPKTQEDAIQKQITNEGVLQPEQSEMELQGLEQRDTKQEVVAEQGEEEKVEDINEISKAKLNKKEINTLRASLRASSPDSLVLEVIDAVAKGEVLGYDYELDSVIEDMIENGISINNIANLILQDDVLIEKKNINSKRKALNYVLNIGEKGTMFKLGQRAIREYEVKKATDRLSKAYDAYKNIGIVFDPEGNWKKDKELVSSLVELAVSKIKLGSYNTKKLIADLAKDGIEISLENAKYIFDKASRKFKSDINKAVGIKPKATEQKRIDKAFGIGIATQKIQTEIQKEKVKSTKEELSTAKKEIQDVFSAAKESLKIEKDKNKVINKLKVDANAFIKASITDLKAGDIGNRAITSIASKIQSITDQNFEEKLLEINTVLDNLYTNRDVNTAKDDSKKAFKNVMSGKVGKLDERGDRDKVMSSKVVNFTKLEPKTLKKVVDEADFEQYKDYISRLSGKGLTLSETDLKTIGELYDRISKPYSDYVAEVNRIQQIIDAGGTLTKGESDFIENNKSDFSERETPETLADKEAKKLERDAKKEAEIAKKKTSIKELLPSIKSVFESSNAVKGSLEWRMLNSLMGLSESDVDSMPDNMLTNALNTISSMVYDDVITAYVEDLYKYKLKTDYKNALVDTLKKAGKFGVYKLKVAKIPLKIREIIGLPNKALLEGINQKNITQQIIDRRIKFFNLSAIDAAVKVYGDTPLFNAFMSSFGKAMSRIASTEEKVEAVLLRAKRDIDKNSKNPQESYMKIVYHLIDTMAKNNVGTTSSRSAMEYFEATVNDTTSKIYGNNYMKGLVKGFIKKVGDNNNQIDDLTPEEANAANAIRMVLDENQINAYEANFFQNSNAAPMIVEYYPVFNSVVKQAENDLARLKSKFGIDSVSIKAGSLEEKTGTAHPIDLNPFTSAFSSVRNVLFQHQLRSEYAAITQAIKEAIAENSTDNDVLPYLMGIQKALDSQFDLLINGAIHTEPTLTDKGLNALDRAFYTLSLGSGISRGVDFAGNMVQLMTINPKYISYSNKVVNTLITLKEEGESETELLRSFYENAEASDVNKMISSKKINTERTEFINKGINKEVLSKGLPSSNAGAKLRAKVTRPINDTASGAVDTLVGFGDVKPYAISWNGIFYEEFLEQAGEEVNIEKIARGDIEYLKKYKEAISKASSKANQENADLYGSTNPMEKKIGIMEIASKKVKNSVPGAFNALKNKAAYFFASFDMNAKNDMSTAINTYIENQETRNARRFIGGAIRFTSYSSAISYIGSAFWGWLKGDDDDEEKLKVSFDKLSGDDDFIKEVNNFLLDYPIQKDADGNVIELNVEDLEKYDQIRYKLMQNKDFAAAYDILYGYLNRDLFDNQVKNKIGEINSGKYEYDKSFVEVFFSDMDKGFGKSDDEIVGVLGLLNSQQGYKLFTEDEIDSYILKIEKYMADTNFLSNRATRDSSKQIDKLIVTKTASILSDYRSNKSIGDIATTEGLKLFMGMMLSRSNNFQKASYNFAAEFANKQMIQSRRGERGYDAFKDNVFQTPIKAGLTDKDIYKQLTQDAFNILFPALTKVDKYMYTDYAIPDLIRFTPLGVLGVNDFSKIDSKMKNDVIYQNTNGKYRENIIKDMKESKIDILRSKEDIEKDSTDNKFRKSRVIPGVKETQLKSRFPSYKEGKDLKVNGNRAN